MALVTYVALHAAIMALAYLVGTKIGDRR